MIRLFLQMIKFAAVGVIAAAVDFGGYLTLTRLFVPFLTYYVATSAVTSVAAVGVAYLINRRWTFQDKNGASFTQYGRYLAVYGAGIVWQNLLLALFVELVGFPDIFAKALAVIIVGFGWNFLLAKMWVFRYN